MWEDLIKPVPAALTVETLQRALDYCSAPMKAWRAREMFENDFQGTIHFTRMADKPISGFTVTANGEDFEFIKGSVRVKEILQAYGVMYGVSPDDVKFIKDEYCPPKIVYIML